MKDPKNFYNGFTLLEVLVVMSVIIILGGMGTYAFSGLRDSVVVNQDISNLKMDVQRAQHSAMLLRRESGENWPYGIGIDFSKLHEEGKYSFFKWVSESSTYDSQSMGSELIAFDEDQLGINSPLGNGMLVIPGHSKPEDIGSIVPLSGFEDTYIKGGFEINLRDVNGSIPTYLFFESVTGRAFLYASDGYPVNYTYASDTLEYNNTIKLSVEILRNQGNKMDVITIAPGSGTVTHAVEEN